MICRLIIPLLLLSYSYKTKAQEIPVLYPVLYPLDFSKEGEKEFQKHQTECERIWKKQSNSEELTKAEQEYVYTCREVEQSYWEVIDAGCSWYCGGDPYKITASSFLPANSKISYKPENAHDLDYESAWVEGVKGYGIGEYLLYHFKGHSPRINTITIANGYVKSESAWSKNSRVKTLKMYVNDTVHSILNLEDARADQVFVVPPIGNARSESGALLDTTGWTIKFEITGVYKGDKYDDVVISEIYFDGLDVHCLSAGTLITMADSSEKKIEYLQIGDEVLSYIPETDKYEPSKIVQLASANHTQLMVIKFSNGASIKCTKDHPFLSNQEHWLSLSPDKTTEAYNYNEVYQLDTTSNVMSFGFPYLQIKSIDEITFYQKTYTIVKLEEAQSFIANGLIVGTEELRIQLSSK